VGNSIADPAIKIKLMLDQSTAEQVNAEISKVLQKAVTGAVPVFKKIEEALTASVSKVDISSQLVRQLETGVKALKKTGGTEELIRQFAELDRAAIRCGDTMVAQSARIAKAIAEAGLSNKNAITVSGSEDVTKRKQELEAFVARAETHAFNELCQESRVIKEREQAIATENKLRNMQGQFGTPVLEKVDIIGPLTATVKQQQDRKKELEAKVDRAYRSADRDFAAEQEARRQEVRQFAGEKKLSRIWEAVHQDETTARLKKAEEENIQRLNKKQQALDAGFTPTDIGNNSDGWDPAKRARIEAHSAKYEEAQIQADALVQKTKLARQLERIGEDPAEAFAKLNLSGNTPYRKDMQGQKILTEEQKFARLRLGNQTAGYSRTGFDSGSREDLAAQQEALTSEMLDGYGKPKGSKKGAFNAHSFRFVSQQVGFGIDDAIQSYHYGGVGASARAASNNLTAIAGMGIANPAIAAGTVVALSIATAALPVVLKQVGIDKVDHAAGASARYGFKASSHLTRGESPVEHLEASSRTLLSGLEDNETEQEKFTKAHEDLRKFKGLNEKFAVGSFMHRRASNFMGAADAAQFNAAYEVIDNFEKTGPKRRTELQLKVDKMRKDNNPANLEKVENLKNTLDAEQNYRSTVTDLPSYEKSLKRAASAQIAAIPEDVAPLVREAKTALINMHLQQSLSQQQKNKQAVKANRYRKEDLYDEYGTGNPLEQLQQGFKRSKRAIDDNVLLSQQEHENLTRLNRDQATTKYNRSFQDQMLENLEFTDPIAAKKLQRDRKNEDYDKMLAGGQIAPDDVNRLQQANNVGFARFRARAVDNMLHENDINNPLGDLGHKFARAAEDLQQRFDEGEYSNDEKAQMEANLKRKYEASKRELDKPQGTERFSADVAVVGSAADNELRARMLGTFTAGGSDDSWKKQTLEEMRRSALAAEALNRKLEFARLKL
jgi:hypothetical protein